MLSVILVGITVCVVCATSSTEFPELATAFENVKYRELNEIHKLFDEFKQKYNRQYKDHETAKRFSIFGHNLRKAEMLQVFERGTAKYGITRFADLTEEEFQTLFANLRVDTRNLGRESTVTAPTGSLGAPTSIDWRKLGAVTAVQDQGSCGSCWTFGAIGAIEGQWFRKTKRLIKLSEQQLLDCDRKSGGCQGGDPMSAYDAAKKMGGLEKAAVYPYVGKRGNCLAERSKFVAYINGSVRLSTVESNIADWIASNGPVCMALNAETLQSYRSGIMHPTRSSCNPNTQTHAVLGVGYGVQGRKPFWIIKNTWGEGWGEKGYFRIYRGDGTCGINKYVNTVRIF